MRRCFSLFNMTVLSCLLLSSSVASADKHKDWPISLTIDTSTIDYRTSLKPHTLTCDYDQGSRITERGLPLIVNANKIATYTLIYQDSVLEKREYGKELRCEVNGASYPGRLNYIKCHDFPLQAILDIGHSIQSGQCSAAYE